MVALSDGEEGMWDGRGGTHECGADAASSWGAQVWLSKLLPIAI